MSAFAVKFYSSNAISAEKWMLIVFILSVVLLVLGAGMYAVLAHQVLYPAKRIPPLLKGVKVFFVKYFLLVVLVVLIVNLSLLAIVGLLSRIFPEGAVIVVFVNSFTPFAVSAITLFAWPNLFMLQKGPMHSLVIGVKQLRDNLEAAKPCLMLLAVGPLLKMLMTLAGVSLSSPVQYIHPLIDSVTRVAAFILSCLILLDLTKPKSDLH